MTENRLVALKTILWRWAPRVFALLAIALALLPAIWSFRGQWLANTIVYDITPYYRASAVCLAAALACVWLSRPSALTWLGRSPDSLGAVDALQAAGEPEVDALFSPRVNAVLIALFGAAVVVDILLALSSGRAPGFDLLTLVFLYWLAWQLRENLPNRLYRTWQSNRDWLPAYLLFSLATILGVAFTNSSVDFPWAVWLVVAASAYPLWRRRKRVPFGAWTFVVGWLFYSFRLDHWLYAAVGDEYAFYTYARDIFGLSWGQVDERLFNCCAVYGMHPFISSLVQSGWMALFGTANFGWRGLNPFLCAMALPFYYAFFRNFVPERTARVAVLLLAGSSYLMDFVKIGYNNPQAFWAAAMLLAAGAAALRRPSGAAYTTLGLAASLCLYLYPPSLYALPVAGLLMLFYAPPLNGLRLGRWALAGGIFIVLGCGLLFDARLVPMRLIGTFAWSSTLRSSSNILFEHTAENFGMALASGYYAPEETHYVVAGYQDPIGATLACLGLGMALTQLRRSRFLVFFTLSFLLLLYLVGSSHDRSTPSTTRMFILLPWFSLYAALGLDWLAGLARRGHAWRAAVLAAVLALNLYQAYGLVLVRDTDNQSLEALFIRLTQDLARGAPQPGRTYTFLTGGLQGIEGFSLFQSVYKQYVGSATLHAIAVDKVGVSGLAAIQPNALNLILLTRTLAPQDEQAARQALKDLGWQSCAQEATDGRVIFWVYYTPDQRYPAGPCSPLRRPFPASFFWPFTALLAVLGDIALIVWLRRRRRSRQTSDIPAR